LDEKINSRPSSVHTGGPASTPSFGDQGDGGMGGADVGGGAGNPATSNVDSGEPGE